MENWAIVLRRLYDWTMDLAGHRHALRALAVVSFVESSFFPIPPDLLIIPMILAARHRAWLIATVCTLASVAGGLAGYAIGALFFDTVGQPIVAFFGYMGDFAEFQQGYEEWGAWIVAGAGVTPFPYKVITITSGFMDLDLVVFTIASVLSRGARFFVLAALLWKFGPSIRVFIETYLPWLATAVFILLFVGFLIYRYLA